ncbi:hypothetical protein KKB64_03755 [Patescibacteria group bacterium]|nr:hypothetical protein [Patescibacteria group bacterium]MBU1472872.1 hypothetical protein [Patescibacteria group bacterium]MBU2460066.1 hypothetical protein [Patescibacteria group bacterium]MBU2544762.1 hypothetical protein [Patescibacteria group bacterium]
MTTTVVGKESDTRIVVEKGVEHYPTGNPFYTLFVHGGPTSGEVWLQLSIGKLILPIPLPFARDIKKVDKENPDNRIWDANKEHLGIHFTQSPPQ